MATTSEPVIGRAGESPGDRASAVVLIAYVRWAGVALGVLQAYLVTDPRPIGGPWFVLLATAVMAAYNLPATLARRFNPDVVDTLRWACLVGDFAVCTAWTMLVANDVFSTTYAIYILVGIEAAFLYGVRGAAAFSAGFLLAYAALYWERAAFFGFPVLISSLIFRSAIVLVAAWFAGAMTEQSQRRRAAALHAGAEARRQADLANRRTDQLDSLLHTISDMGEGVVTVSDGKIIAANEAYCRLTGYELSELLNLTSFTDVIAPDVRDALTALTAGTTAAGASGETMLMAKSGEYIPVDWATRHVQLGGRTHIIAVVRDIRDRKRVLQLIEAERDKAEQASRAKSEYLSRMSHELRTPMTAILGFAELLELEGREEDRDAVGSILKAGGHLLSLINDALDISRIEAGREAFSLEAVGLASVFEECAALMRPLAESEGTSLIVSAPEQGAEYVAADRQRLTQVFLNLLSNGVKYTGTGSKVVISARASGADRVHVAVSDDGPGIPQHQIPLVFEPFERLGAERTRTAGTGLGLALTKRIVESMGGDIGLETAVGRGSTFWVELNAAPPAEVEAAIPPAVPVTAARTAGTGEHLVLYVEDNLTTIRLIERIFALRPSLKLLTAMQGSLAMDLAREHRPELIVLDVHLPDIDGDEVLRRLQDDESTRNIPVIMLSADATQRQVDRLLAAGAKRYITKPVSVTKFLDVLDSTLQPEVRREARGLPASQKQRSNRAG